MYIPGYYEKRNSWVFPYPSDQCSMSWAGVDRMRVGGMQSKDEISCTISAGGYGRNGTCISTGVLL